MSWKIVLHAFQIVFGNIGNALKVSVGPILVATVLLSLLSSLGGGQMSMMTMQGPIGGQMSGLGALTVVAALVLFVFLFAWIAVSWHRFVLLEEYPGLLPKIADRPIAAYAGKSMLLALMMVLLAIPVGLGMALVMTPVASSTSGAANVFGSIVVLLAATVVSYFWFRIAIVLPGTALGKPMTIGAGWAATSKLRGGIFGVALILVALNIVVTLLMAPISTGMPLVGTILGLFINWVTLMLGVSILTTLYGHLVEGRDLVD